MRENRAKIVVYEHTEYGRVEQYSALQLTFQKWVVRVGMPTGIYLIYWEWQYPGCS